MLKFQEDLNRIISTFDGNRAKAAEFIGVSGALITKLQKMKTPPKGPTTELLAMKAEQCKRAAATSMIPNARIVPIEKGLRRVPVVASMRAGYLDNIGSNYDDIANQIDETVETDCRDDNAYALIVEGDSMSPRFIPGDRVIMAPNYEPRNGEPVCARLEKDGSTYFKIFRQRGDEVILESLNAEFPPLVFKRSDFRFIHPAVDLKSKLRR